MIDVDKGCIWGYRYTVLSYDEHVALFPLGNHVTFSFRKRLLLFFFFFLLYNIFRTKI